MTDYEALGKWCREKEALALDAARRADRMVGMADVVEDAHAEADRYAALATLCEQRVRDEALAQELRTWLEPHQKPYPHCVGKSCRVGVPLMIRAADRLEGKT